MTTEVHLTYGSGARMAVLEDESVPLVVTSPPYFPDELEARLREGRLDSEDIDDAYVRILGHAWTLRPIFNECWRVLMPGGRMVVQTRDVRLGHVLAPVESAHRQLLEATGLRLYTRHLWRPKHTTLARQRIAASTSGRFGPSPIDPEVFLVFCRPGPPRQGEPTPADVELLEQDVLVTSVGRLPTAHRFQSPIPVLEALIRAHSRPGDLVVDPCAGGGTVLLAARRLGRSAFGCDVDLAALQLAEVNLGLTPRSSQ
jgi:hypothetical protein